jgi:hypothetical protein
LAVSMRTGIISVGGTTISVAPGSPDAENPRYGAFWKVQVP